MSTQTTSAAARSLAGQVVVVTGASRGIGAAIAQAAAAAGASVAVNYAHGRDQAETTVRQIHTTGADAVAVEGDVRDEDAMGRVVDHVGDTLGDVDALICSAAGMGDLMPGPLVEQSPEAVAAQVTAQLTAILTPAAAFTPAMRARGRGHLVAVGSGWSRQPAAGFAHVGIAKAAADAAVRSLAVELGRSGVRANVVAPGFVHTSRSEALPDAARAELIERTPLHRAAEPDDIAHAVVALLGPAAGHLTGAWLPVDGGMSLT